MSASQVASGSSGGEISPAAATPRTGFELYRASKAALNQLMRSYATRHAGDGQTLLLIDPGHNRTRLGGPDAPFALEETMPGVVDVLEQQVGAAGLQFLDHRGEVVAW